MRIADRWRGPRFASPGVARKMELVRPFVKKSMQRHEWPLTRQYGRRICKAMRVLAPPELNPEVFQRLHATDVKPDRFSGVRIPRN
jgi:hypothetical protein